MSAAVAESPAMAARRQMEHQENNQRDDQCDWNEGQEPSKNEHVWSPILF